MSHTQGLGLPWDALLYVYQYKNMQKAKKEQYYKEKKNVVSTIVLPNSSFKTNLEVLRTKTTFTYFNWNTNIYIYIYILKTKTQRKSNYISIRFSILYHVSYIIFSLCAKWIIECKNRRVQIQLDFKLNFN